jgi:hypothetical protein
MIKRMDTKGHRSLVKAALDVLEGDQNMITDIKLVEADGEALQVLREGNWIDGRFKRNIRIDQPTHFQGLQGQQHAAIHGRKGDQEGVVNYDGSGSHGTKGRLHPDDADALRAKGYKIPDDNIVEWTRVENLPEVLFG